MQLSALSKHQVHLKSISDIAEHVDSTRSKVSRGCRGYRLLKQPDDSKTIKLSLVCLGGQLLALFITTKKWRLTAGGKAAEGER